MSFTKLLNLALIFALTVTALGAFVRLSNAGLGCPDWPGCYGNLTVPDEISQEHHAERPLETHKAWKEMVHRYAAGGLVLLVLALGIVSIKRGAALAPILPIALLALILFQALLGMWTVTLKLKPLIVMAHLLGGFSTLALLWWWRLAATRLGTLAIMPKTLSTFAVFALIALIVQIALGGWTSANYAALACPDFPACQSQWWPEMDFSEAFILWRGLGIDYEFGVLESPARTAIHLTHRIGAFVMLLVLGGLSLSILKQKLAASDPLRTSALILAGLLALQISLGISNVVLHLPITIAVAHNVVAALLLLCAVTIVYFLATARRWQLSKA